MDDKKIYSMLGLAKRAGRIASGAFLTEKTVKAGEAWLVLVAEDASDRTKKEFTNICHSNEAPLLTFGQMEKLGHATGTADRSVLAITDENFASRISELIQAADR